MFAQINHMAIISANYLLLDHYYRAMFKFDHSGRKEPEGACIVSDGCVGLNILPRRDGYVGGIDHFGIKVDSIDEVFERMQKAHPKASIVKRPTQRSFAAYSGHDPDGNVFDLTERGGANLKDVHATPPESGAGRFGSFNRFAIRTFNPEECVEFYSSVFGFQLVNRKNDDANFHLTDGKVTLSIMPWSIEVFAGMSIKRPGPDHIGIKVENLDDLKKEERRIADKNTFLISRRLGGNPEAETRRRLIESNALGGYVIADPDGNWLDVTDQ